MTAETYIADIVAGLEERHGVSGLDLVEGDVAPTGDAYVIICSGGEKAEAGVWPALCTTPQLAAELWADAIVRYAKGRTGQIYWRARPVIERLQITIADRRQTQRLASDRYTVYSRLFIAAEGMVPQQPAEVAAA